MKDENQNDILLRSEIWGRKTLVISLVIIIITGILVYFSGISENYQNIKPKVEIELQ